MGNKTKNFYAVARGRKPGIYLKWGGPDGARAQVNRFKGAVFKGFATFAEAKMFMQNRDAPIESIQPPVPRPRHPAATGENADGRTDVFTDGSALGNPGPGGWAVVIPAIDPPAELSGGFRLTTNNRMELTAAIMALRHLRDKPPAAIRLHTDSRYVVDGITKGWAAGWRSRGWRKSTGDPALNADLWAELLELCERCRPAFKWVPGHAGVEYNELCDRLAREAASMPGLPADRGYERIGPAPKPPGGYVQQTFPLFL